VFEIVLGVMERCLLFHGKLHKFKQCVKLKYNISSDDFCTVGIFEVN
jgi:hypothetical protein